MRKENFVSLTLGAAGVLLLGIGMCMALLPEWNAFRPGIVMGAAGLAILLAMALVRRKMKGLPPIKFTGKAIGTGVLGVAGALALGLGMCMTMVWNLMIPGILVGIVGIAFLFCLIPACKGLQ